MAMSDEEFIAALKRRILSPELRADNKRDPPQLYPPVDQREIENAEEELDLAFPPLLSRLYREVANGGFGPGGGMLGLREGHGDSDGQTLVEVYKSFRKDGWPRPLLPLWEWGGPAWSCIDARSVDGRIVTEDADGPVMTKFVLRSWLESWLVGVELFEEIYETSEGTIINPFTRKPVTTRRQGRAIGTPVNFAEDVNEET